MVWKIWKLRAGESFGWSRYKDKIKSPSDVPRVLSWITWNYSLVSLAMPRWKRTGVQKWLRFWLLQSSRHERPTQRSQICKKRTAVSKWSALWLNLKADLMKHILMTLTLMSLSPLLLVLKCREAETKLKSFSSDQFKNKDSKTKKN